ncbi:hypothetical protein KR767_18845 [Luteibacter anthropi]|uniref:hypothetical protein n=1 Tax=Luteibacter anthropi TaxID=564369 RepID=UPI00203255EB|nr:hypothetical protein [Luteibacter anthropi]URX62079.1 hypothetical protein KR767_18845 [Luteibacter anthropi]
MPDSRFPRVVGFEVPPLSDEVDVGNDAPIVALLDIEPTTNWLTVFDREVASLKGELGIADVTIEGDRVLFYGSVTDARRLADAVRALVERISRVRLDERLLHAGASPLGNTEEPSDA